MSKKIKPTGETAGNKYAALAMPDKDTGFTINIPDGADMNAETYSPVNNEQPKESKQEVAARDPHALINRLEDALCAQYEFRYNVIKNVVEFRPLADGDKWQEVDERQAKRIEADLLRTGKFKGVERVLNLFLANVPEFDPVAAFLDKLPEWDKADHIETLASFVDVAADRRTWFNLMFKKHLIRLVACASGRLPFNKHCLVLVSGQNDGKTTFLRYLVPDAWNEFYSEDLDFQNKDGLIALARNLFINLDELRNLSKHDINLVKSYLSKDTIKARLPFDKRETKLRRRATFFGSTNNSEFLTDETGNVRWLVFEINGIRHDHGGPKGYAANVDLLQVYAQAWHLVKSGYHYQLTREEIEQSERYNAAHTVRPLEYELLLKHYDKSSDKDDFATPSDIKKHLEATTGHKLTPVMIGKALRMLNVERSSRKVKGQTVYGYLLKQSNCEDYWKED